MPGRLLPVPALFNTASNTIGIGLIDDYANRLDQNTITGAGTPFQTTYNQVQRRSNYPSP